MNDSIYTSFHHSLNSLAMAEGDVRSSKSIILPPIRGGQIGNPQPVPLNIPLQDLVKKNIIKAKKGQTLEKRNEIKQINERFKWNTAQIGSLFKAIAKSGGVVTEQDAASIEKIRTELQDVENQLEGQDAAIQQIHRATKELDRLDVLRQSLPHFLEIERLLDEEILDVTSHEQSPLCGFVSARKCLEHYETLSRDISYDHPLAPFLEQIKKGMIECMEEWGEDLVDRAKDELERFKALLITNPKDETGSQLLASLSHQLWQAKKDLEQLSTAARTLGLTEVERSICDATKELAKVYDSIPSKAAKQTASYPAYGSSQWQELLSTCPASKKSWVERLLKPQDWSDSTKDTVFRLMAVAQLMNQGIGLYRELTTDHRALADALQRDVMEAVPEDVQQHINREVSVLERLLVDKYSAISGSSLQTLTKKYPEIRPTLEHIIKEHGSKQPTVDEIRTLCQAYRLQRFIQESPKANPTKQMQWQASSPSEKPPKEIKLLSGEPLPTAIATLAKSGALHQRTSPAVGSLSVDKQRQALKVIQEARILHDQLGTTGTVELEPLRELIALSLGALLKSSRKLSRQNLSLTNRADLMQQIDDQCFAIEELEKLIGQEMDKTRKLIHGDVNALRAGGKKHTNIVLQHRLVEALKMPGITVPIPQAINSEQVHALLRAKAPEVYTHWQALGGLYTAFQGPGQFLASAAAKEHLQAIDVAIAKAFEDNGAFEALAPSPEMLSLLSQVEASGDYLMVRSTGAEDSKEAANAGGNVSLAYISANKRELCQAWGKVVRSYFGAGSLQNRLNAKQDPFSEELKLAVTIQQLVGEPVGGALNPAEIPTSLVLFSNEPLYVGNEPWRVMRISASFGHGEGVVGNQGVASDTYLLMASEAEPDKLYIMRDIKDKPERLAPIQKADGTVALGKVVNPSELRTKPALSDEELIRLYHYGVVGEKFFEDSGTDMEIVTKQGEIYPVQARPVNRPQMLPTYVDLHKIGQLKRSPITQTLHTDLLVAGKASVVQIHKSEEILTAQTLEEAEKKYDKELHKLVIVHQDEPANSHPVVNFSNLGVPCLVAKDATAVKAIIDGIRDSLGVVTCVQKGDVHLWDSSHGKIADFTAQGFGVHPAKLAISLPLPFLSPSKQPLQQVPDEVKQLLIAIRNATTTEAGHKALQELQQNSWVSSVRYRAFQATQLLAKEDLIHPEVSQRFEALANFGKKLNKAISEAEATFSQSDKSLKPLFRAKIIESLLVGRSDKAGSLGQFSAVDIVAIDKDIEQLLAYQKELSHPPHLMDMVLVGNSAITPAGSKQWSDFLMRLEQRIEEEAVSPERIDQFKELIKTLESSGVISSWLTFFFPQALQESHNEVELLGRLILTLPKTDATFIGMNLQQQQKLASLRSQIDRFASPESFSEAWQTLQTLVSPETQQNLIAGMAGGSPSVRMIAINTMKQLVDVYDDAIKAFESSNKWGAEEKIPQFKEMLGPFMTLLRTWHEGAVRPGSIPTHAHWPIHKYLDELEKHLRQMPEEGEEQLLPRREFDVSAAVLGTTSDFSRMYPERLVEAFTLIHQNLLGAIGSLQNDLISNDLLQQSNLPDSVKGAIVVVSQRYPSRLDLKVDSGGVSVKFNVPLRNHSGQLNLIYDKQSSQFMVEGHFFVMGRNRPQQGGGTLKVLSDSGILPIVGGEPKVGEQSLSAKWQIATHEQLELLLEEYAAIAQFSLNEMGPHFVADFIDRRLKNGELVKVFSAIVSINDTPIGKSLFNQVFKYNDTPIGESLFNQTFKYLSDELIDLVAKIACNKMDGDASDRKLSLELFRKLIIYNHQQSYEPATQAASKAILNHDLDNVVLFLLDELVNRGYQQAYEPAAQIALEGIRNNWEWKGTCVNLLTALINQGYEPAFEHAALALEAIRNNGHDRYSESLLITLINQGYEPVFEQAAQVVLDAIRRKDLSSCHSLLIGLINQGYEPIFEEATQVALGNFQLFGGNWINRSLFNALVERGYEPAFGPAYQAVLKYIQSENNKNFIENYECEAEIYRLLNVLVKEGYVPAFELALQTASDVILKSGRKDVERTGLKLFQELFDQGYEPAFETAASVASKAILDTEQSVRDVGLDLFERLFETGRQDVFEEAAKVITTSFTSAPTMSSALFKKIVNCVGAYDAAALTAKSLWNQFKYSLFD